MIPISGRTSLEGHTIALQEKGSALIVSLDRMDKIIDVNEKNGDAVVQAVSTSHIIQENYTDSRFTKGRRLGGPERTSVRPEHPSLLSYRVGKLVQIDLTMS